MSIICLRGSWNSQRAIVNNKYIEILTNLHHAICHVRSKTETVVIWADTICINQSDIDEKSRVALMVETYRQCSMVYVWPGIPNLGSLTGNPFQFLEQFYTQEVFLQISWFRRRQV